MSPVPRVLVLSVVVLASVVDVAASAQDLESVERRADELRESVAEATAAYEEVWATAESVAAEIAATEGRAAELQAELDEVSAALTVRARTVFMHGSDGVLEALVTSDGPTHGIERAALVAALASRGQGRIEAARSLRIQLRQTRGLLEDRRSELEALRDELAERKASLSTELSRTEVLAADLRQREARKRRVRRGVQDGTYACIFERGTTHFRDTWGAPRSGGRRHKGTDVFSWFDAPVFAFTDGRIHRVSTSRLGGLGLYLWGDDGNLYYYAHLNRLASTTHVGKRVEAGELVAYNGDSGNARGGAPHVHYQLHPGGGAPINPYPWLAAACF